eukprot:TRINITY_DN276_c0_g1_i2.p2 TRINITY_DN276_c0_g1~~TRINITY_DN276_c0_g1_i2.p2  ORF type:complete len:762 (+),score=196.42 TRINITY_DN276_c0_g1_i2:47-2287(+)
MTSTVFAVTCNQTRPGELVFVVGSHGGLGAWKPAMALPLTTTAAEYPTWSSVPVPLPAGQQCEYKFIIQREDRTGAVRWEDFPGNHILSPEAGKVIQAMSTWSRAPVTTKVITLDEPRSRAGSTEEQEAEDRKAHEDTLMMMAESGLAAATEEVMEACPLAVKIADREVMKRNFSQSLLCLDDIGGPDDEPAAEEKPQSARGLQSMPHVMSFTALSLMADPEEKESHRKALKAKPRYEPYNLQVPVVIVTSEVAPYSKTGGLGLVASSYSYEFAKNGHRTMVVSPKYRHYDHINYVGETRVRVNDRDEVVKYWHKRVDYGDDLGTDFIFVEHPSIQRDGGLYNGQDGREYEDNLFRFTLVSMAAMEAPLILNLNNRGTYGDKIIFLANDWQSGLVPVLLCYKYRPHNCYSQSRCIYAIHNLGYQGQYHNVDVCRFFGIDQKAANDMRFGNAVNMSKGALICADRVITVSPNYAKEIQTAAGGFSLQDFVCAKACSHRLAGILNGIDDCWDPASDSNITHNFSVVDYVEKKRLNKVALQKSLDLKQDENAVLIGFVGRLTWQKGVDVMASIIEWMMQDTGNGVTGRIQFIMMGNGEKQYADALRWAEQNFKGRVCGYVGFDPKVEHQMMAGCDLFLMPSRYEPCGLPQMYAQMYGTLPIVTATGGLVDSVKDVSEGIDVATGFHIPCLAADKLKEVVYKASEIVLKRPADFRRMQRTAMQSDYYWPKATDEYERNFDVALYESPTVR